jgi:hypothetical protein
VLDVLECLHVREWISVDRDQVRLR